MIYSVVPEELAAELYDRLVDYYKDDPNVTVIVDRRRRGGGDAGPDAVAAGGRERRERPRVSGDIAPVDAA
jgi:hypothetical protein